LTEECYRIPPKREVTNTVTRFVTARMMSFYIIGDTTNSYRKDANISP